MTGDPLVDRIKADAAAEAQPAAEVAKFREDGDSATSEFVSDERIQTLDDAVKFAGIDTSTWFVERWECSGHEVTMKVRDGNRDRPVRRLNWRVKLWLKRVAPRSIEMARELFYTKLTNAKPVYPAVRQRKPPSNPHLLSLDLYDVHFGKLAWEPEVGETYDLRITEAIYEHAVDDLLGMAAGFPVETILIPLGHDFFHVDSINNVTTAGTPQDTDGRYAKIIDTGTTAVIRAIEQCLTVAPVHVAWVPGNHDRHASYHLCREIEAWFRGSGAVTVDVQPIERKYIEYGTTLLGLVHGHREKHSLLPTLMATEKPQEWARTTCREWKLGHYHTHKRRETAAVDTHDGVVLRLAHSLSAADSWHHGKGFTTNRRAAEACLYSRDSGFAAQFVATARDQ